MSDYNTPPEKSTCPICGGAGQIPTHDDNFEQCGFCSGNGVVSSGELKEFYEEQFQDDLKEKFDDL